MAALNHLVFILKARTSLVSQISLRSILLRRLYLLEEMPLIRIQVQGYEAPASPSIAFNRSITIRSRNQNLQSW